MYNFFWACLVYTSEDTYPDSHLFMDGEAIRKTYHPDFMPVSYTHLLIDAVKKYGADAVIVCMMKFCDPEEFDYPILIQEFEAAGVRNLQIEIDQESTAFEQVKTRIQTFAEIL